MTNKALRDIMKELPAYAAKVNGDIHLIHKRFLETSGVLQPTKRVKSLP